MLENAVNDGVGMTEERTDEGCSADVVGMGDELDRKDGAYGA